MSKRPGNPEPELVNKEIENAVELDADRISKKIFVAHEVSLRLVNGLSKKNFGHHTSIKDQPQQSSNPQLPYRFRELGAPLRNCTYHRGVKQIAQISTFLSKYPIYHQLKLCYFPSPGFGSVFYDSATDY
ncbi:hypothetical protein [Lyngbya aestuarii]|uniref:hypothetical protein n=1 Tax=Lyngbya aestuarii TaxID=118322 RepID=UPI00403DCEFF